MIFQRRFHSHTPTTLDSPPTPPPKDASPPKTLEEILAIAVSPRAPKPPPHAVGTVASNPRIVKTSQSRSASSPLKSTVPRRAPSSRKTGHATIHTDAVDGHDAFESDAFAVHMPTTRIPIIDAPVSRPKAGSPTRAQAEAVQTYKEKAKQARERNNSIGVRIPPNIASYDYAYASTPKTDVAIPAALKPSGSPPAPAGAFPVSPPTPQDKWTRPEPKPGPVVTKNKISSNTSVYRKPTILGVTTAAAVIEESVHYARTDTHGGASRPTSPPKTTTVKITMNPRVPSVRKTPVAPTAHANTCEAGSCQAHTCPVDHCRGLYYRTPHVQLTAPSRSPSPTKTMPNFTRQYSVEGDSIFGYKVKDPLGTVAGADKSISSSSEDERPKVTTSKTLEPKRLPSKRTLADRWPWMRKGAIGKPPTAPAPDPPVKAPTPKRPMSIYTSPFEALASPPSTPPPVRPTTIKPTTATTSKAAPKAAAAAATIYPTSSKETPPTLTPASPSSPLSTLNSNLLQIQSFFFMTFKFCLAVYTIVALWFILDSIRETLCLLHLPFLFLGRVLGVVWAIVKVSGRVLGGAVQGAGGIRVLGR